MTQLFTLILLHFLTFSLLFSLSLSSRTTHTHTSLDVSASIQSTLNLFSLQNQHQQVLVQQQEQEKAFSSSLSSGSPSLIAEIHPRASLHAPANSHKDYKSLTESRLARDAARVKSLLTKADLATRGISRADLKPAGDSFIGEQEDFQAPVSSGTSQGSGEYFSRLGVGSPAREYFMVIDTGSDVNWIQCQPCSDCYQQSDPIYNPSSSSSFSPLGCSAPQCSLLEISACRNGACLYQVSYGDGSFTVGDFVTETVSFGQSGGSVSKVALGCGHDNEGLFVGAAGLMGLGGGHLSLPSQIKATSFSYCLVDRDSTRSSTLEFNSALPRNSVTAPILKNTKLDTFYYVGLTGFSVGGQLVSIPPSLFAMDSGSGGVIVDSGTAITRLPTQAYNALRDAFTRLTQHLRTAESVALFDTCYDFSSLSSVKVPTVGVHFAGGEKLDLPAKNYLIPVDSSGTFCFAFAQTSSSMSIIGNVQQQGTRVHFDLARSLVAFSPNNC